MIYKTIRDRICLLEYQPGERLGEEELAREFNLSCTPIRRVLSTLESEGLGQPVRKGDVIARIWPADRTGMKPVQHRATMDGILAGRHFPGLVKTGDCVAVTAQIV